MKKVFSRAPAAFWKFGGLAFAFARRTVLGQSWRRVLWGSVGEKCGTKSHTFRLQLQWRLILLQAVAYGLWVCGIVLGITRELFGKLLVKALGIPAELIVFSCGTPQFSRLSWRKPGNLDVWPFCLECTDPTILFATEVMLGIAPFVAAGALESHCIFLWPPGLELGTRFGNVPRSLQRVLQRVTSSAHQLSILKHAWMPHAYNKYEILKNKK